MHANHVGFQIVDRGSREKPHLHVTETCSPRPSLEHPVPSSEKANVPAHSFTVAVVSNHHARSHSISFAPNHFVREKHDAFIPIAFGRSVQSHQRHEFGAWTKLCLSILLLGDAHNTFPQLFVFFW